MRLANPIAWFEELLCSAFLVAMISVVIINVLLRFAFSHSLFWAEEVATICFVWCVFLGAAATYKRKMDIGIDFFIERAPLKVAWFIRSLVLLFLLFLNATLTYLAVVFTVIAWEKPTAVLGISSAVINSALIVGFGLITLHTLRFIAAHLASREASA